jgi:hypothetical protein
MTAVSPKAGGVLPDLREIHLPAAKEAIDILHRRNPKVLLGLCREILWFWGQRPQNYEPS